MSRVGRKPIPITKGVSVEKANGTVKVKGPKGEMSADINPDISVSISGE